jgi:hypothetical protein
MTLKISSDNAVIRDQFREFLDKICPDAKLKVAADGSVSPEQANFCAKTDPPPSANCTCLCDLIKSGKTVKIEHTDKDLSSFGGNGGVTFADDVKGATNGTGSDAVVRIDTLQHAEIKNLPPKEDVLKKQLCEHAVPITKGTHKNIGGGGLAGAGAASVGSPEPGKK